MIGIAIYLFVFLGGLIGLTVAMYSGALPEWVMNYKLVFTCCLCGGFGGILYCLRGVYLNYSVKKSFTREWYPWYIIRPFVSILTGGVSFLFLKAGLLVLEAQSAETSTHLGFYALAFIAGLNVDKFVSKNRRYCPSYLGYRKIKNSKR
jgi:hypothetical protein